MMIPRPDERDVITSPKLPERGPTKREKRQVDDAVLGALKRRIEIAKREGAVNISVGIDFLLDLMSGTQHGVRNGYKPNTEV